MRRGGLAVVVGALVVLPGTAAVADEHRPQGRVESVVPSDDGLDIAFVGTGLPRDGQLNPDDVRVFLGGVRVEATVLPADSDERPAELARRAMLVIDTSGSMAGDRLRAAKDAAAAYLQTVPAEVEVGLIDFSDIPRVGVRPTVDRGALQAGINSLVAQGNTSLYDAVLAAGQVLGNEGDRRILVLSDGEDTASRTSLAAASAALPQAGITLDAVLLGDEVEAVAGLRELTESGTGRLLQAVDTAEASTAFASVAHDFEPRTLVHAAVPEHMAGAATSLRVELGSSEGPLSAEAPVVLREQDGTSRVGTVAPVLGGLALAAAVLLLVVVHLRDGHEAKDQTHRALAAYTLDRAVTPYVPQAAPPSRLGGSPVIARALVLVSAVLTRRGWHLRVADRLDRAALRYTPDEWVFLQVVSSVGTGALVGLLSSVALGLLVGAAVAVGMHLWLARQGKRRSTRFISEMPDALQMVASSLSSGYSLPQALEAVVQEGREPVSAEFGRALAETRLGGSLEDGLDTVARRIDVDDFRWVVMAIRVQREVGGNLAEVLTTLGQTMRDRESLRRQVKALSAEGRMSTYVLIALPFGLAGYMATVGREYWSVMWQTPLGLALLAGSVVSLALGGVWMNKLAKVEM